MADFESNPYTVDLEFPGTTDLIPDVSGQRVLDAGSGSGRYGAWLLDAGAAEVVAVDASPAMLDVARDRLGERAEALDGTVEFHRSDLADGLEFAAADAFDGVVCGLVLHYLEDWRPTFEEFARVLRPGGFVVFSVSHPADEFPLEAAESYFATRQKTKEWTVEIPDDARPFSARVNPVLDAGFRLEEIVEPEPTEGFREKRPDRYETESRHPVFVAFRFVLPPD
ncbi:MAG: class I SAM-dependent methyltransferase [Haloarculaceae archaeon]